MRASWRFSFLCAAIVGLCATLPAQIKAQRASARVAVVEGQAITEADLNVKGELMQLEQKAYQIRVKALDLAIGQVLVEKEAARRKTTIEKLLETEVDSKIAEPDDMEVLTFYERQKRYFRKPFDEIRAEVTKVVKTLRIREARLEFVAALREKSKVEILLDPPRMDVNIARAPRRGSAKAPVTIVEFSDFQCPYCKRMQPVMTELMSRYGGQVSWVFKDLPLKSIHSGAVRAAVAARCAGDQGKFWEYRDALFEASRVTDEIHGTLADKLSIDAAKFEACLASDKYNDAVDADLAEARRLGINGTPAFIVNGILLSGAQPLEAFTRVIDAELARPKKASAN